MANISAIAGLPLELDHVDFLRSTVFLHRSGNLDSRDKRRAELEILSILVRDEKGIEAHDLAWVFGKQLDIELLSFTDNVLLSTSFDYGKHSALAAPCVHRL